MFQSLEKGKINGEEKKDFIFFPSLVTETPAALAKIRREGVKGTQPKFCMRGRGGSAQILKP